jgi:uncharacterized protein YqiB (DUF1249 family)
MIILRRDNDLYRDQKDLAGTFAGLMDLYERNYIGVRRLIPTMPAAGTALQSCPPGALTLHLEVIDRFPYTTELALTYYFVKSGRVTAEPELRIRVYNDARQAEVLAAHLRRWPAVTLPGSDGNVTGLHTRWRINRFLYKWLSYCLHQGHRFG